MTNPTDGSLLPESHIGNVIGRIADDYLASIAMAKSSIYDSLTLPFMHSHALELAAKAAALRTIPFELDYSTMGILSRNYMQSIS